MTYVVAVDIGGTFTDLAAYDSGAGYAIFTKSPTNYSNFVEGMLDCLRKANVRPNEIEFVNHGTTLVINSLIQRRGAKSALITTKGFRDVLEIARGNRPDPFDLHYTRDVPLIPRHMRFEIDERISSDGSPLTHPDRAEIEVLAKRLTLEGVESIAIFFMNSYIKPNHEKLVAEMLRALLPGVYVTTSTELTLEWYEYERVSTVAANAFVGPQVNTYVKQLEGDLLTQGFSGSLFMMGSNGGLLSVDRTCRQPIALVESGPIGGCIGAGAYAEALGLKNIIAFDMGGTTAKCALLENGHFSIEGTYYVGGYVKGVPIRSPVIDIVEVGSGGGSIAWLDPQHRLHVGPESAGSSPGPACYGRGGAQATVTDANIVLGRINPERFLGGELALDTQAATDVMDALSGRLGFEGPNAVVQMADGILAISTVIMGGAIKQVSLQHGFDPRDFALFCYGGGGPLHGSALARELSIPTVVIPPEPGNFSAVGMLLADARIDSAEVFAGTLCSDTVSAIYNTFLRLEADAAGSLQKEFGATEIFFERVAEMRYVGQRHNIRLSLSNARDDIDIRGLFTKDYTRRYGHADPGAEIEFQMAHLSAFARRPRPNLSHMPRAQTGTVQPTSREVYFDAAMGAISTPVYQRVALPRGFEACGPAVIEEYGSTTIVWPGDRFEIGQLFEICIHLKAEAT